MAGLRREVALLALPVLSLIAVILCHLIHANPATTVWITAAFTAGGGALAAALAIPRHPQAIGAGVVALFTILAHYWWHLGTDVIAPGVVIINLIFGIGVSLRITPTFPPAQPQPPAAA
jgi:hypothetical protein